MCLAGFASVASAQTESSQQPLRWWKGNLHTHTFWSDGNDFPEMVAAWYAQRDYNFLALSDHNILSRGIRWMPLQRVESRADAGIVDRYRAKFGPEWVETRSVDGRDEVRLKPLDEYRCLVEQAGKFIMIEGEEISDQVGKAPVHMNATNLSQVLKPAGGATVREAIRNNLRMIMEHQRTSGREVMAHVNHPNFHYAITASDLASVVEEQFYEVYNGHPDVHHLGDKDHMGIEPMWDVINAIRLLMLDAPPILGIATDDSHEYHGRPGSRPGRGWVMVRSRYLTPEHLIRALKAADFYASSGVVLKDIQFDTDARKLTIHVDSAPGATYETDFIAVLRPESTPTTASNPASSDAVSDNTPTTSSSLTEADMPPAQVVATIAGEVASYQLTGKELYVRAVVRSSLPPTDPVYDNQRQQAWTQPVGWER
ncbi:MAG: hypothetical protein KF752_15475 [Pirellulaceae bacterium]|nr:hypothetical protein [Pirellulaceae bacterium]